jgi:DNA-binding NtrC family response regulator
MPLKASPGAPNRLDVDATVPLREARRRYLRAFERAYLETLLERFAFDVKLAAGAAGISKVHFYRRLRSARKSIASKQSHERADDSSWPTEK